MRARGASSRSRGKIMSLFQRVRDLLGAEDGTAPAPSALAQIEAGLERLDPEQARYIAAFSFVLARVAHADLDIDDSEVAEIRGAVATLAALSEEEAGIVADLSRSLAQHVGGTENYTVTREFRRSSTRAQRVQLLECLFAVAAADGTIGTAESQEIANIAEELGFTRPETNALRASWRAHLAELGGPA